LANPFKTPKFRALFKKWNNILEEAGHDEIENFNLEEPALRQWEAGRWDGTDPLRNEATQQYYQMAEILLDTFPFKNKTQRKIWQLHCEGYSVREISAMIHRKGYGRDRVYLIIARVRSKSGLRNG
jgi:hypothetical protein